MNSVLPARFTKEFQIRALAALGGGVVAFAAVGSIPGLVSVNEGDQRPGFVPLHYGEHQIQPTAPRPPLDPPVSLTVQALCGDGATDDHTRQLLRNYGYCAP
jgi:hypothetical protein